MNQYQTFVLHDYKILLELLQVLQYIFVQPNQLQYQSLEFQIQ